jgi:PRC-barrel domain
MPRKLMFSILALLAGVTIAGSGLAQQAAPSPDVQPAVPQGPAATSQAPAAPQAAATPQAPATPLAPATPVAPAAQAPAPPPPVVPKEPAPAPVVPAEPAPTSAPPLPAVPVEPAPTPTPPAVPAAPAPAPAPPVVPAEPAAPPVVPAEQVASAELTGLLGEEVVGPGGTELGHIVDVLVDTQGRMRAVVVDVGGFMGVGSRKVAVAWSAVRFSSGPKGPVVSILIPIDRIKSWAEYIAGRPVAILGAPGSTQ